MHMNLPPSMCGPETNQITKLDVNLTKPER